jgi:hypothetical protein
MKKPKYVYHGGSKKLIGKRLIPKKARDLGKEPDNMLQGIYASDSRNEALAMGILSCKGVKEASCGIRNGRLKAILYSGEPKQDYFYVYTLKSETFENRPKNGHQWVSLTPVKPLKIERLLIKDYLHLIKMANEKDKKEWYAKYPQLKRNL